MSVLKVARMGHPVLRQVARELTREEILSPAIQKLIDDMVVTMKEYRGVGLAAPQVHESVRLAIIEFSADNPRYAISDAQGLTVFINPKLEVLDPVTQGFWEGCLSVPGLRGYVERPRKLRCTYLDREAKPRELVAEGFLATVLQHEFDHLDGVLYVDRLADPRKFGFIEELQRFGVANAAESAD